MARRSVFRPGVAAIGRLPVTAFRRTVRLGIRSPKFPGGLVASAGMTFRPRPVLPRGRRRLLRFLRRRDGFPTVPGVAEVAAEVANEGGLPGEGLVRTVGTDEPSAGLRFRRLVGMLRPAVLPEFVVRDEAAPAVVTVVRSVVGVPPALVQQPVLGPAEAAVAERAAVGLLEGVVAADVVDEVARLVERDAALVARERCLAGVNTMVNLITATSQT